MEPCVDNCREDLLKKVNLRMTTKNFLISCAIVAGVIGTAGTLVYTAYAGGQKEVREAVKAQTEVAQQAQRKLTEIEVNQRHVMSKQDDFKEQIKSMESNQHLILQQILMIREHQVNGE